MHFCREVGEMNPLLSVVIVNYNYGRFLETAIRSVVEQEAFDQCELIVVDGGSTDNSVEIIKKYAGDLLPNTRGVDPNSLTHGYSSHIAWWVSEPDKGQSDAFNKAFAHASGRLGCWLNADDVMLPGTLQSVIGFMNRFPDCEWIGGGMIFADSEMKIVQMRIGTSINSRFHDYLSMTVVGGPSSFFSISRLKDVGGFNVSLRYIMDVDLWRRLFRAGVRLHHIDRYFWCFRLHKDSKTASNVTLKVMSQRHSEEHAWMRDRDHIPSWKIWIGGHLLRAWKLCNGSMMRSWLDTARSRGKCVFDVFNMRNST